MEKCALITGASRGIGAAIATKFAENGYNLCICCYEKKDLLFKLAEELKNKYNIQVITFVGDVSDYSFCEKITSEALAKFGQIDVLINNAAISHIGLFNDMSVEEWDRLIGTNLSVWGNVGASCEVAYSASKGAVNSFTKALAKELAPSNIQVNAIACGVIDTDMNKCFTEKERQNLANEIPAGRFGNPEEVAKLALDLATDNDYLTGQIITIDGAWI